MSIDKSTSKGEKHTDVNLRLFPNKFIRTRRIPPFSHFKLHPYKLKDFSFLSNQQRANILLSCTQYQLLSQHVYVLWLRANHHFLPWVVSRHFQYLSHPLWQSERGIQPSNHPQPLPQVARDPHWLSRIGVSQHVSRTSCINFKQTAHTLRVNLI